MDKAQTLRGAENNGRKRAPGQAVQQRIGGRYFLRQVLIRVTLLTGRDSRSRNSPGTVLEHAEADASQGLAHIIKAGRRLQPVSESLQPTEITTFFDERAQDLEILNPGEIHRVVHGQRRLRLLDRCNTRPGYVVRALVEQREADTGQRAAQLLEVGASLHFTAVDLQRVEVTTLLHQRAYAFQVVDA